MVPRCLASPGRAVFQRCRGQPLSEATCARICNRADLPDRRNLEAPPPNPEPSEWAIGRLRRAHLPRTVALSAAFGRAARRGRRATMDIPASGPPAAAAEAPRGGGGGEGWRWRRRRQRWWWTSIGAKKSWRKSILLTRKTARGGSRGSWPPAWWLGRLYCKPPQRTASGHLRRRRRPFRPLSMRRSAMTRRPSSSFSDLTARTLSNPAIPPKTRTLAPSLRARLTKSSRSTRTP